MSESVIGYGESAIAASRSGGEEKSVWPEMRRDRRNTGASPYPADYTKDRPWSFVTGRGIFTTPVVGPDGAVYIGSADGIFYALEPGGELRWSYRTGGVIDSAALVGAHHVSFGSGDGFLYRLRTDPDLGPGIERCEWRFAARSPDGSGQQVSWWEGNVEAGPEGLILAGNTAGHAYAVDGEGREVWAYPTGNAVWTAAAVGDDGTSYWGSLDFFVHAVDRNGALLWKAPTLGFVVSSPALSSGGTLYAGSFDGVLYALDSASGDVLWTFTTGDSIYSSPGLLEVDGSVRAVFVGSTDGSIYALDRDGQRLWRYDTGDVVRSSPVISPAPAGESGWIVYVGSANGVVYALDAATGARRWSFDTTMSDPVLGDRNSLNGSPALGETGIYIGSEDGSIWYLPYDYPLHSDDPRCSTDPNEPFPAEITQLFVMTPGGATVVHEALSANAVNPVSVVPLRLVVRRGGVTLDAEIDSDVTVECTPPVELSWRRSGDGHVLFVSPSSLFESAAEHQFVVRGHWRVAYGRGDTAPISGELAETVTFRTAPVGIVAPLGITDEATTAFHLRRLSVALPSFAPSVNQIGFDSYDWLIGTVAVTPDSERTGNAVFFVHGAVRDSDDVWTIDPQSPFAFAMAGRYEGDAFCVAARGVDLPFSFGNVPVRRLDFRFQLGEDLVARPGANMYGEIVCADIPFYGPLLSDYTRLPDAEGVMTTSGTFLLAPADPLSQAQRRPRGVQVAGCDFDGPVPDGPSILTVRLEGDLDAHVVSVLLLNPGDGSLLDGPLAREGAPEATAGASTAGASAAGASAAGASAGAVLRFTISDSASLPEAVDVVVVTGVFPLFRSTLLI